ncbi:MAG: hypothetical protein M3Y27_06120, partial [Acidobacteriota bacterium]|nr:hypothetical protein [Acidobacteriota bacterium]
MNRVNRRTFLGAASFAGLALRADVSQEADLHVCPKSQPPARTLVAFRLDELTSNTWDMRLTLHCLQGIVNRSIPQLFLVQDRYDELWLDWLRERGDIDHVKWPELGEVFERFLPEAKCMFITDPAIPATVNVATMLASVHDGLVATPANASQFNLSAGAYPDSSKVGMDLRVMHWKKDVDTYRWAYDRLGSSLSRQAIPFVDPATAAFRDYLIQFRIPILWICSPSDVKSNPQASFEEEYKFARDVMMQWPSNIPCLGWPGNAVGSESGIGEWEGVRLISQCAKFEVCSAYDGYSPTVSNVSVHSGTRATYKQKPAKPLTLERDKISVAFTRSDGDGWNFQRHYYRKLFDDSTHGRVPVGWQIGPTATDGIPDILDFYYKHATPNDYFINALSGVGYIHEDNYADNYSERDREAIWREFIRLSGIYRQRIDTTALATFAEMQPSRLALLAGIPGIQSIFANYGRTHLTTRGNLVTVVDGKPVFRAVNGGAPGTPFTPDARQAAV